MAADLSFSGTFKRGLALPSYRRASTVVIAEALDEPTTHLLNITSPNHTQRSSRTLTYLLKACRNTPDRNNAPRSPHNHHDAMANGSVNPPNTRAYENATNKSRWAPFIGLVVVVAFCAAAWFLSPKGENQTYVPPSLPFTTSSNAYRLRHHTIFSLSLFI
jgi:hypothetical protein